MRACARDSSCRHAGGRLAFAILSSAVAASGGACAGGVYRPAGPVEAASPTISARVEHLGLADSVVTTKLHLSVKVRAKPGARLHRTLLSEIEASPCSRGWREARWAEAAGGAATAPIPLEGEQTLELTYLGGEALMRGPTALDFDVDDAGVRRCLRIPLTAAGRETGAWLGTPWDWGFRLRTTFAPSRSPRSHDGHAFGIRIGRWVGPLNLGIAGEGGIAGCLGDCPADSSYGYLAAAVPSVEAIVASRGRFALQLELAYEVARLQRQNPDDSSDVVFPGQVIHGPRAALAFLLTERPRFGLPPAVRRGRTGVELFVTDRWAGESNGGRRHVLVGGVALVLEGGP
jgi:hypothetical protein